MAKSSQVWRVNDRPRFSVLEMGAYMAADDKSRETLLRNMKYERLGPTTMYNAVYLAASRFLASPTRDQRILLKCREDIEGELVAEEHPQKRENLVIVLLLLPPP